MTPMHRRLLQEKLLHGIEVVNDQTYSDEALQIALDHNLTIMGTSDIHGLIDWDFVGGVAGHRPLTLIFAKERDEASLKDALINRRTVALHKDLLIGREEFLVPLIKESLVITKATYTGKSSVLRVTVSNRSSVTFTLSNKSGYTLQSDHDVVMLKPAKETVVEVKTLQRLSTIALSFEVLNAVNAPGKHPTVTWQAKAE
jgi:hypothetical protein